MNNKVMIAAIFGICSTLPVANSAFAQCHQSHGYQPVTQGHVVYSEVHFPSHPIATASVPAPTPVVAKQTTVSEKTRTVFVVVEKAPEAASTTDEEVAETPTAPSEKPAKRSVNFGKTYSVRGSFFGNEAGEVRLIDGKHVYAAEVKSWSENQAVFTLPENVAIAGDLDARIVVLRRDGVSVRDFAVVVKPSDFFEELDSEIPLLTDASQRQVPPSSR